ncbi:adenylate/guanylate cyclase catalytic domain protein, partial [Ostertagia ostertagi]
TTDNNKSLIRSFTAHSFATYSQDWSTFTRRVSVSRSSLNVVLSNRQKLDDQTYRLRDIGCSRTLGETTSDFCDRTRKQRGQISSEASNKRTVYEAPELLKNREKNRLRRMDQEWMKQSQVLNMDLTSLILDCWNTSPEMRPSVRRIKLNVETYLKVRGSLVDQMMRMMEQYANNLEKLVQERTGMLEEANIRADKLLCQLLPACVASELKLGKSVPPKSYSSATILFSDIVGFTELCKTASPLEVVNVLNGVFDGFDQFIARRDAYKYLTDFCVPHKPDQRVVCRLGFHTGQSQQAGCRRNALAVNMSSRMESNSGPGKTQISEAANKLLLQHYPEYQTEERGQIAVKGKGMCTTYWLHGVERSSSNAYLAPSAQDCGNLGGYVGTGGSVNSLGTKLRNPSGSVMSK